MICRRSSICSGPGRGRSQWRADPRTDRERSRTSGKKSWRPRPSSRSRAGASGTRARLLPIRASSSSCGYAVESAACYDKRLAYQAEKRRYELAIRLRDQALERLLAPPSPAVTSRSSLVTELIEQLTKVVEAQNRLIEVWTTFRAERLAFYHDLGVLPYQDWKSFFADLSAGPPVAGPAVPAVQPQPSGRRRAPAFVPACSSAPLESRPPPDNPRPK